MHVAQRGLVGDLPLLDVGPVRAVGTLQTLFR